MNKLLYQIGGFILLSCNLLLAQDIINPYQDYSSNFPTGPFSPLTYNANSGFSFGLASQALAKPGFTGEYQIFVDNNTIGFESRYLWKNMSGNSNAFTFKIESASFPFTPECAFLSGGCGSGISQSDPYYSERKLYMPPIPFNLTTQMWGGLSKETYSPGIFEPIAPYSDYSTQTLVSHSYLEDASIPIMLQYWNAINRTVLPHTILKHTLYIHCNSSIYSSVADSIVWFYDNTRGMMRYYPFCPANSKTQYSNSSIYDIVFTPNLIHLTDCPSTNNGICDPPNNYLINNQHFYSLNQQNYFTNYNTINYFPYLEITDLCGSGIPSLNNFFGHSSGLNEHPAPNILISAPARLNHGEFIAGYSFTNYNSPIIRLPGIMHEYFIDKGFPDLDLNWINPLEKTIFNPSGVSVGPKQPSTNQVNLIFPRNYTFKTILGVYPSVQEVNDANITSNGGPYADLRDVPVPVFASDGHNGDPNYPDLRNFDDPNPISWYDDNWGNYIIEDHGEITVEECVKLFDANFYPKTGGTLLFTNYPACVVPETSPNIRIKIEPNGGAILRNYANIQNLDYTDVIQDYELKYIAINEINAGNYVSSGNDYTIEANNTDVKFEAGQTIRLEPGFTAKEGCKFVATCKPITYSTKICNTPAQPSSSNRLSLTNNSNASSITSRFEKVGDNSISISPNPTTGLFVIEAQSIKGEFTYEVSDIYGRKVLSNTCILANTNIDLSEQPQGMYIVSLSAHGKQWAKKIIKE